MGTRRRTLRQNSQRKEGSSVLVRVYIPPSNSGTHQGDDALYECLSSVVSSLDHSIPYLICGDYNAHIGNLAPSYNSENAPLNNSSGILSSVFMENVDAPQNSRGRKLL